MFRVLFLILVVIGSTVFAQTDNAVRVSINEAVKIVEFEKATDDKVKILVNDFYAELNNNGSATGYIITYGTPEEVAIREKQIRDSIRFRKYDAIRMVFVQGGFRAVVKTELWLVPAGANPPSLGDGGEPQKIVEAVRFEKLGIHSEKFYQWNFNEFFGKLKKHENLNGYILINADDATYTDFVEKVRKYESFATINSDRIIFVKGKPQTPMSSELWLVPKGSELPKITVPKSEKFDEFGKLGNAEWLERMKNLGKKITEIKHNGSQLFIINYGTEKEITVAERLIERYLFRYCRDCFAFSNFKINYLRGNSEGKARRVFWIVPFGGETPIP